LNIHPASAFLNPKQIGSRAFRPALLAILVVLLASCSLFPHRASHIAWPEKIDYMKALCDLDMAWKDMRYSGSMALTVEYPDRCVAEIFGPFGDTAVYLKKDEGEFLFRSGDERITDEKTFEKRFGIRLRDFIDDMTAHGLLGGSGKNGIVERGAYRVFYEFGDKENRICWRGADGSICVRFLEATFSREEPLGKGSNRAM
jgi:hypothetical protein